MLFSVSSSARLGGNTEASRPTASAPCGIYLPKPAPGICEQPRNISLKAGRQASACSLSLLQQSLSKHQFDSKLSAKMVFTLPSAQKQQLYSLLRHKHCQGAFVFLALLEAVVFRFHPICPFCFCSSRYCIDITDSTPDFPSQVYILH